MAIIKSGKTIIIEYQEGETKGNSWSNPYTLDDILSAINSKSKK